MISENVGKVNRGGCRPGWAGKEECEMQLDEATEKASNGIHAVACDLSRRRSFGGNLGESTKNNGQTLMEEKGDQHLDE